MTWINKKQQQPLRSSFLPYFVFCVGPTWHIFFRFISVHQKLSNSIYAWNCFNHWCSENLNLNTIIAHNAKAQIYLHVIPEQFNEILRTTHVAYLFCAAHHLAIVQIVNIYLYCMPIVNDRYDTSLLQFHW